MGYDCERPTKTKLEDETKQTHFLCMFNKLIWWKIKNKETESIFYYGCIIQITFTLLCLIVGRGSNCKFWGKNPQVHLIIIREWPKNNPF